MKATREVRHNFRRQLEPLLPPLVQAAHFILNDEPAAHSAVETAVLGAYKDYTGELGSDEFRTWMFARVVNETAEACGAVPEESERTEDLSTPSGGPHFVAKREQADAFGRRLRDKVKTRDIREAVSAIPYPIRTVLVLSMVADFPSPEISRVVDAPLSTVRTRLLTGRKLLEQALFERAMGDSDTPGAPGHENTYQMQQELRMGRGRTPEAKDRFRAK